MTDPIRVRGARVHNLKDLDVDLPRNRLVAITGVSGSGKSSLAFDTLFREGERRYLSTLSAAARLRAGKLTRPEVRAIRGLGPAVSVGQRLSAPGPRSTVGTLTGLWDLVRLLFARLGERTCPECKQAVDPEAEACPSGHPVPRRQRSLLSFNDEAGACPTCTGLGVVDRVDPQRLVADPSKSIRDGALVPTLKNGYTVYSQVTVEVMDDICRAHGFDVDTPWAELSDAQRDVIFYGTTALVVPFGKHSLESRLKWSGIVAKPREEGHYRGLVPVIEETLKRNRNDNVLRFVRSEICGDCGGSRLGPAARALRLGARGPAEYAAAPIRALLGLVDEVEVSQTALRATLEAIRGEIAPRTQALLQLGLGHLPLGRSAPSLSSGERQRIRLAAQLEDDLSGLVYVLDEPSVDLHPSARRHLQSLLRRLVAAGNSVFTVEHDPDLVRTVDHVVELGPGPGQDGGRLLFEGPPAGLEAEDTPTGRALAAPAPAFGPALPEAERLWVRGATARNLCGEDVPFAKGALNVVTGVSGAGKSTLVAGVLAPAVAQHLGAGGPEVGAHRGLEGHEAFTDVVTLDARPIGRTPRSNPATYTGLFDLVRKAFARTEAATARGFSASRFSFNTAGGRCPECEGAGITRVPMHGLGDVSVTCARCAGRRFDDETLAVKLFGLDVAEVLALEVRQAREALAELEGAQAILSALEEVGLGYVTLGQPAPDLSGGEAQRVRLAAELAKPVRGPTLYVLDEPSKGLHREDLARLLAAFSRLVARGHTLVVVEHDPHVWRAAGWLVDLGPGAGEDGGRLLYAGPPAGVLDVRASATAEVLRGRRGAPASERPPETPTPPPTPRIQLRGVRTHNLKGVDVALPRGALTVISGPSGSGKSSLAFDTLAAEAFARLGGRLGAHVRRLVRRLPRPALDEATGLTPTVALRQQPPPPQPRSTVGTMTEVQDLLRLLFSRLGEPRGRLASSFSFNHEAGACPACTGLGFRLAADPTRLITDPSRPVLDGACAGNAIGRRFTEPAGRYAATLRAAAARARVDVDPPFEALSERARQLVLRGDGGPPLEVVWRFERGARTGEHRLEAPWPGLLGLLEEEYENTHLGKGAKLVELMRRVPCEACAGRRLGPRALEVTLGGEDLGALSDRSVRELQAWLRRLGPDTPRDRGVLEALQSELLPRLEALDALGLGHLHPNRGSDTLSGGERMRVALAAQIGAPMTGATFVLDEPTRGLHPVDIEGVLAAVRRLVEAGNTVVMVDHAPAAARAADHLIRLGPGGGPEGGEVTYAGPPDAAPAPRAGVRERPRSLFEAPAIALRGLEAHNLRALDVDLPGAGLTVLAGPSGAGKSTLLGALREAARARRAPGLERFDAHHHLDAAPLAGGWSSVLATALGVLDPLRTLYAKCPEAKASKLGKAAFSFSSAAGRCPACKGQGRITVALDFLPDARSLCDACGGARFSAAVRAVKREGLSIDEALGLDVKAACAHFSKQPGIARPLAQLEALGLGHLTLDRPAPTLSGGEAQRVRLARHLSSPADRPALFLLDEPSRGLDAEGTAKVRAALLELVGRGHAVVCISHHLDLIANADHVIELGPGGGPEGGWIVFEGPPTELSEADTATGRALRATRDDR